MNVGQHIVDRLVTWGVHRVYGYPGDGSGGVLVAVHERKDDIQFVQVRHEETAAFAATADVKYGGSPIGCLVVTSGPGALHALNGLYDALTDRDLSFVSWETRALLGAKPDPESASLPDVPYAAWSRLLGLAGARLEEPRRIDAVLDEAFSADRPYVIDAVVDPNIPIIPPHLTADQVLNTAKAEFQGDPAFFSIVAEGVRETVVATVKGRFGR
jgi:thiamine pyrophosphate-dependent acetolactate synthase large subunit-like protein